MLRHVLRVDQFTRTDVERLIVSAAHMRTIAERGGDDRLRGRILATMFFEPSTRTRMSFESAMIRLGGRVITMENASETSSAVKGETIEDTVRIVETYADAIVIRHPVAGIPERGAQVAAVPIINAGDGAHEHPTQALLDVFTIQQELGRIDDITVALVGDLRYGRAPRSLAMILTLARNCRLILVAPPGVEMSPDVLDALASHGVEYRAEIDLVAAAREADVVYMTRVQKERFPDERSYLAVRGQYQFGEQHLEVMRPQSIVLHPLPRVDEIDPAVDSDPRAAYFRQARNGVFMRMALLDALLNSSSTLA
ncbi:MAG: aspartate carbamoyltransferase [Chloroflexi bacterium]|nr:MAG: aspartate carbamoyltransferase [Chloroflexota bacterium]